MGQVDFHTTRAAARPGRSRPVICVLLAGVASALLFLVWNWIENGLDVARESVVAQDYSGARAAIERYRWLHPHSIEARLVAADAFVFDDSLNPEEAARQAIAHWQAIPDTAAEAAEARMMEGRLTFLILQQPGRGEKLFRRAIELDADQFDSHYLLWKLLEMTERYFYSESEFWETYRLAPADQRAFRLREWYLSQFSPLSACGELDARMGFRDPAQPTSESVAYVRLKAFFEHEGDSPVVVAALSNWHFRNGDWQTALEILEDVADREQALGNQFYVATLIDVLLEAGEFERALEVFSHWPSAAEGYQYCRLAGIINQDVHGDHDRAIEYYDAALAEWPGPSDWPTMHRKAHCLARLGRSKERELAHQRAERVENLMDLAVHQRLKAVLTDLTRPQDLVEVLDFYKSLERPREVREWESVIASLEQRAADETRAP